MSRRGGLKASAEDLRLVRAVDAKDFAGAVQLARSVLRLRPRHPLALKALSFGLIGLERYEEALPVVELALDFSPNDGELHNNRGIILSASARWEESVESFRRAVSLTPDDPEILKNLGAALIRQLRWNDAVPVLLQAIEKHPGDYVEAIDFLASCLLNSNRLEEARVCYQELASANPREGRYVYQLVSTGLRSCYWSGLLERISLLPELSDDYQLYLDSPFVALGCPGLSADTHLQIARVHALHAIPSVLFNQQHRFSRRTGTRARLRVGYLSADLRAHPVGISVVQLFECHNRERVEVFAYSLSGDDESEIRVRLSRSVEHFVDLENMSNRAVIDRIRADEIDLLVDLHGWTSLARAEVLAERVAPVQVNWLGYPGTIGDERLIDYVIGDPVVTPLKDAAYFTETIAQLPHSYMPADMSIDLSACDSRASQGLPEQGFIFCSFNNSYKFNPFVFDCWSKILRAVPGSVLWLSQPTDSAAERLKAEVAARGVEPERLIFAKRVDTHEDHIRRAQLADLALDPFPYNSHSSGVHTLISGVPMITKLGDTFAGRVGASLLRAARLDELIVEDDDKYVELAVFVATNEDYLRQLREKLRLARSDAPLFDTRRLARDMETLYRRMVDDVENGVRCAISSA